VIIRSQKSHKVGFLLERLVLHCYISFPPLAAEETYRNSALMLSLGCPYDANWDDITLFSLGNWTRILRSQ